MAKIKLTKSAVDAAQPQAQAVELRGAVVPASPRRAARCSCSNTARMPASAVPALGFFGKLTVEQAPSLAQEWLAEVRRGGDPGAAKSAARKVPTMKELCETFMEDYSKQRNKPSMQRG